MRSLYVHVPFCFHKCHYCDFYSIVDTQDRQGAFLERLLGELEALAGHTGGEPLETVFFGGGTPTLMRVELWERVLERLGGLFGFGRARPGEFTVECNPETATAELMRVLAAGGVNRISMGAQSFRREHLKTLERWHEPESVERAVELARGAGIRRVSVDLIFGIPGQGVEEWAGDVRRALGLGLDHVSCYGLTYEPNTAMTARLERGEFAAMEEEAEVEMFEVTGAMMREAGLRRYEVSNFAREGEECRHNLVYWRQGAWLAAGPSASGHVYANEAESERIGAGLGLRADEAVRAGARGLLGSHRWKNVPRLGDYLAYARGEGGGYAPVMDHERPDPGRLVRERIMTGLRLAEGLEVGVVRESAELVGGGMWERVERAAKRAREEGLLMMNDERWVVTEKGMLRADGVAGELMRAEMGSEGRGGEKAWPSKPMVMALGRSSAH